MIGKMKENSSSTKDGFRELKLIRVRLYSWNGSVASFVEVRWWGNCSDSGDFSFKLYG